MPAGVQIINTSNTVLINEDYKAYALRVKGTVTLPGASGAYSSRADVSFTSRSGGAPPMLALVPTEGCVITDNYRRNGNVHTWSVRSNTAGPVEYYIFDLLTSADNAGGLFQVFDGSSRLIFDSNLNYLRIAQMIFSPVTSFGNSPGATKVPVPSGKKYAVAIAAPQYYRVYRNTGIVVGSGIFLYEGDHTYQVAPRLVGSVIEFNRLTSEVLVGSGQAGGGYSFSRPGQFTMVIDVTGN